MAGRDKRRGSDLDNWFDEPERPIARGPRPNEPRARADVAPAPPGLLGALSEPRLAAAAVVAIVVLFVLGLALTGVFDSATPRRAATTAVPMHPRTTTAASTAPQPSSTAVPSGPLKPGDQGSEVKLLQRALARLGYSPGAVDGNYGVATQHAITRFQSFSKLIPDGVLGPQTLLALRSSLNP